MVVVLVLVVVVLLAVVVVVVVVMAMTSSWTGAGAPGQAIAVVDAPETGAVLKLAWGGRRVLWDGCYETGVLV